MNTYNIGLQEESVDFHIAILYLSLESGLVMCSDVNSTHAVLS